MVEQIPVPRPESPSQASVSFETNPEVIELKKRIEKLEGMLTKETVAEEKEKLAKQEIKTYLEQVQQVPSFAPPVSTHDETDEIKKLEPSRQVGALIAVVFEKGLPKAISLANSLNNPALLDELHDSLVDRYYKILIEKELLKP